MRTLQKRVCVCGGGGGDEGLKNMNQKSKVYPCSQIETFKFMLFFSSIDTITPKELPIVQEITSVVREWYLYWRQQYEVGNCFNHYELG